MAAAPTTNGFHSPKIILYTNHACPWVGISHCLADWLTLEQAHRAHIALKELKLSYEEVIIDLSKPREEWYLKVNPVRRLLPDELLEHRSLAHNNRTERARPRYALFQW